VPTPEWVNQRDSLHQEIAKLRGELADRDLRIESLNYLLIGQPIDFWRVWHLTAQEEKILQALMSGRLCSKDYLMDFLYAMSPAKEPGIKIIDVFVCKLRNKLENHNIAIDTVWGRGYRMSVETIARVKTMCAAPSAAAA